MRLMSQLLSNKLSSVSSAQTVTNKNFNLNLEPVTSDEKQTTYKFTIPSLEKGEQGNAATIHIGNVTVGDEPAVINVGTPYDAILDITLPRGLKGEQGKVGPQGPIGERGLQGPPGAFSMVKVGLVDYSKDGLVHVIDRCEERPDNSKETLIDFYFPRVILDATENVGIIPTIEIGEVTVGDTPSVTNVGTKSDAILNFVLPNGAKGDIGLQGVQGEKGDPGEPGKSATIKIGTVTVGDNPAVTNVGTDTDAILDITLPRSEQGEQGVAGIQGERGPQGPRGERGFQGEKGEPGKSAYDIAVEQGFTGTIDTWLSNLKEYMISLEVGNVSIGESAAVTFDKTSETSYKVNFVLPVAPVDTSNLIIDAKNIVFEDNTTLHYKYITGNISDQKRELPFKEIGIVQLDNIGSIINERVTDNGLSIVSYVVGEEECYGLWLKYDNARLGLYLVDDKLRVYLDIGNE